MIQKILRFLGITFGWILILSGGLCCISGIICFFACIFGGLEVTGFWARVQLAIVLLFCTVVYGGVCWLGLRLKAAAKRCSPQSKRSAVPPPQRSQTEPQVPPQKESPRAETPSPKTEMLQNKPAAPQTVLSEQPKAATTPAKPQTTAQKALPKTAVRKWVTVPDLTQAVESGPVGMGNTFRGWEDDDIVIQTNATDAVKYYYFADGTLVFAGVGDTKCVNMGGCDGRNSFRQETPPWSELVQENAVRAIFTEGVVSVGSGLLNSLKKLEEVHLADSVREIHYNMIKKVHILRCGMGFRSFSGFTGPLTELQLPDGAVHFQYHNSGRLPGVTGATPEIQAILDEKLRLEFSETIRELFRAMPQVAAKMSSIAQYHKKLAASTICSLNWNSKYKSTRLVPESDLYGLHGLTQNKKIQPGGTLDITIRWNYGLHSFVMIAALVHAAVIAKPKHLRCHIDMVRDWNAEMTRWWAKEFPETALTLMKPTGEVLGETTVQPAASAARQTAGKEPSWSDDGPQEPKKQTRIRIQEAKATFTPQQQKQMDSDFYQFTQDVGRGGLDPEQAAANRGLVFVNGCPVHSQVARRMDELAEQRNQSSRRTPYQRAERPYETAGPKRTSLHDEESAYFLLLSETKLAPSLAWGQSESLQVDTRTWQPYYIIEQYDGAAVAQTWYEVKEPVSWAEVAQYADPNRKYDLCGNGEDWKDLAVFSIEDDRHKALYWRAPREGYYEAGLSREGNDWRVALSLLRGPGDPSAYTKSRVLTEAECTDQTAFYRTLIQYGIHKKYIVHQLWTYSQKYAKTKP